MKVQSFRELIVWQRGIELTVAIYGLTKGLPKEEMFGLTSQIRRAAISIPSNIAGGQSRGSQLEFRHFLMIARGSNAEVQTQLTLIQALNFADEALIMKCDQLSQEIGRLLNGLIGSLRAK